MKYVLIIYNTTADRDIEILLSMNGGLLLHGTIATIRKNRKTLLFSLENTGRTGENEKISSFRNS